MQNNIFFFEVVQLSYQSEVSAQIIMTIYILPLEQMSLHNQSHMFECIS